METITLERTIPAPIETVFDWCSVTSNWQASFWVIRNRLAKAGVGDAYGVGAVRVHLWLIGWFHERITRYERPSEIGYVVDRSFPPSRHEGGSMAFTAVPGGTRVVWTTRVSIPIPLLGGIVTRWLARPMITLVFGNILRSCARRVDSAV